MVSHIASTLFFFFLLLTLPSFSLNSDALLPLGPESSGGLRPIRCPLHQLERHRPHTMPLERRPLHLILNRVPPQPPPHPPLRLPLTTPPPPSPPSSSTPPPSSHSNSPTTLFPVCFQGCFMFFPFKSFSHPEFPIIPSLTILMEVRNQIMEA